MRSTRTRRLHFYYRVRNTSGSGAVNAIATSAFSGLPLDVAFRTDGLGTVPPRRATRSPPPGALVTFELTDPPISCAQHQESRFILIKTTATTFKPGGMTELVATTGAKVSVPTVMP